MDIDARFDLPGGTGFEDVTGVFQQAANGMFRSLHVDATSWM